MHRSSSQNKQVVEAIYVYAPPTLNGTNYNKHYYSSSKQNKYRSPSNTLSYILSSPKRMMFCCLGVAGLLFLIVTILSSIHHHQQIDHQHYPTELKINGI